MWSFQCVCMATSSGVIGGLRTGVYLTQPQSDCAPACNGFLHGCAPVIRRFTSESNGTNLSGATGIRSS